MSEMSCPKILYEGSDQDAERQFWAKFLALGFDVIVVIKVQKTMWTKCLVIRYDTRGMIKLQRDNFRQNVLP